jgi:hypothetical protein
MRIGWAEFPLFARWRRRASVAATSGRKASVAAFGLACAWVLAPGTSYSVEGGLPAVQGQYQAAQGYPRVFMRPDFIRSLAERVGDSESYTHLRFDGIAKWVRATMAKPILWDKTYWGCDVETYLYAFSVETGSPSLLAKLRRDLDLADNEMPPVGAAVVAARLALYATVLKAGVAPAAGAPDADTAIALAKRILLAWSDTGFRDASGEHIRTEPEQFCFEGKPQVAWRTQLGLQVSRGMIYFVYAQDLLSALGSLDAGEKERLKSFDLAIYDLIGNALRFEFSPESAWKEDCERFGNHISNQLTAMLAIASVLDDGKRFDAVLRGGSAAHAPIISWTEYFNEAIYGVDDEPRGCYANRGVDAATSFGSFNATIAEPGEIVDRNRNAHVEQGMGYPMFALERMFDAAEILNGAGFRPYSYRGAKKQSLELPLDYYACFVKGAGFGAIVTADSAAGCANAPQYIGRKVEGAEVDFLIGAYRFPNDERITDLESQARSAGAEGPRSLDPILFGRWRD